MLKNRSSILIFLLISWIEPHAEIYKWIDANGDTHYGEQKPANSGADVKTITPTNTAAPAQREHWRARRFADEEAAKEQAETAKDAAAIASADAQLKADCEQAQRYATSLERPRVNKVAEDGTRTVLGEDARQAEMIKAAAAIKEYCK